MRLSRWCAALVVGATAWTLAACGGGSGGTPAPAPTTPAPPVSVSVKPLDAYARNLDGIVGLWMTTNGAHASTAKVTVRFDVPAGKKLKVHYQPTQQADWDDWPALRLSSSAGPRAGLDTLTGSFSVPVRDDDIWRLFLAPQYGPSGASDAVTVHATLSAGGRTLATDTADARLTGITVTGTGTGPLTLHRDRSWTEADYTVTDVSARDMTSVYAGVGITDCGLPSYPDCDAGGTDLLGHVTVQKYDGGRWSTVTRADGATAVRVLGTSLKAGAAVQVRLRFAVDSGLGKDVEKAHVVMACSGRMSGQKTLSSHSDPLVYDVT